VVGVTIGDDILVQVESSLAAAARGRAGARHLMHVPMVATLAHAVPLVALAGAALGRTRVTPFRATLFDKSPGANWLVAWHQDTALPLQERRDAPGWTAWSTKTGVTYAHAPGDVLDLVVALRVHLDDSTAANGPLVVLPGTHTRGVLGDNEIARLARKIDPCALLTARGGVIAMKPIVVHASSKSVTPAARRVLHLEYTASLDVGHGLRLAVV
jgi:ectoine hydroxylase-related dioxygenase (phytanoyl-CoA dioxygenase family)